jgi:chromosome segregation protein
LQQEIEESQFLLQELEKEKEDAVKLLQAAQKKVGVVRAQGMQIEEKKKDLGKRLSQASEEQRRQEAALREFQMERSRLETSQQVRAAQLRQEEALSEKLLRQAQEWRAKAATQIEESTRCSDKERQFLLQESQLQAELGALQAELAALKGVVKEAKEKRQKAGAALEELRRRQGALQAHVQHASNQLSAVLQEGSQRFDLDLENEPLEGFSLEKERAQLEKEGAQLKKVLAQMNHVNLMAVEEYDKVFQRHEELSKQINDLDLAQSDLLGAIEQLEGECRRQFNATFETVRAAFVRNFGTLFGGGAADLRYEEEAGGIEIYACPPGKQMRSISLLSGGEKCLTCIALLFALFDVRPSPFCLLDEMDAPLDESNVGRFVDLVKSYTDTIQFLIITHNKRTMAASDTLIGVSMEERGVSKVLSLPLAQKTLSLT